MLLRYEPKMSTSHNGGHCNVGQWHTTLNKGDIGLLLGLISVIETRTMTHNYDLANCTHQWGEELKRLARGNP